MRILLGTHYLAKTGGTECYTYALAMELKRLGHDVEYFANVLGHTSNRVEELGVPFMTGGTYDLILANHTTVVPAVYKMGYTIQTCHGAIAELEQPSPYADAHVAVSLEVADNLRSKGYEPVAIIHNGIDCDRFYPKHPVNDNLRTVLSLCQGERGHNFVKRCCERAGYEFIRADKYTDNVWDIERLINQADLVVGLGRSVYDAMSCGRCALIYDFRDYVGHTLADGLVTLETIRRSMRYNCNGKAINRHFDDDSFIAEMQKYSPTIAKWGRSYATRFLNIKHVVKKYLNIINNGRPEDNTSAH